MRLREVLGWAAKPDNLTGPSGPQEERTTHESPPAPYLPLTGSWVLLKIVSTPLLSSLAALTLMSRLEILGGSCPPPVSM